MCGGGNKLESTFWKILEKFGVEISENDIDSCHHVGDQGCTIVKFLKRKDTDIKRPNIQKITAADLDLPDNILSE